MLPGSLINLDFVCSKMGVIPKDKNNATFSTVIMEPQVDKSTNQNDTPVTREFCLFYKCTSFISSFHLISSYTAPQLKFFPG